MRLPCNYKNGGKLLLPSLQHTALPAAAAVDKPASFLRKIPGCSASSTLPTAVFLGMGGYQKQKFIYFRLGGEFHNPMRIGSGEEANSKCMYEFF